MANNRGNKRYKTINMILVPSIKRYKLDPQNYYKRNLQPNKTKH